MKAAVPCEDGYAYACLECSRIIILGADRYEVLADGDVTVSHTGGRVG
jgi:hypothetical protein